VVKRCTKAFAHSARSGSLLTLELPTTPARFTSASSFAAHYAQLVRLAMTRGADEDAEDVVEEAFCQLQRRWSALRDTGAAVPYLRSVVCNLARMRLRHLEVVRRHPAEPPLDVDSPESAAVMREDRREVIAALRRLPARQRQALVLRFWYGLHEAEVADAMGISCGAVKAHTARGIRQLRSRDELRPTRGSGS
jgi:RNA polymerase sigma-70 factor (sigma-E family)